MKIPLQPYIILYDPVVSMFFLPEAIREAPEPQQAEAREGEKAEACTGFGVQGFRVWGRVLSLEFRVEGLEFEVGV